LALQENAIIVEGNIRLTSNNITPLRESACMHIISSAKQALLAFELRGRSI